MRERERERERETDFSYRDFRRIFVIPNKVSNIEKLWEKNKAFYGALCPL